MRGKYDPFRAKSDLADRMTEKTGEEYFVVFDRDLGRHDVASQYDLDTFYLGIPDSDVLYSTVEGIY